MDPLKSVVEVWSAQGDPIHFRNARVNAVALALRASIR